MIVEKIGSRRANPRPLRTGDGMTGHEPRETLAERFARGSHRSLLRAAAVGHDRMRTHPGRERRHHGRHGAHRHTEEYHVGFGRGSRQIIGGPIDHPERAGLLERFRASPVAGHAADRAVALQRQGQGPADQTDPDDEQIVDDWLAHRPDHSVDRHRVRSEHPKQGRVLLELTEGRAQHLVLTMSGHVDEEQILEASAPRGS